MIRPRGKRWQVDVAHEGQRVRRSCRTEDEARLLEAELNAALLAGKPLPVGGETGSAPTTLGSLRDRVMKRVWEGSASEETAALNSQAAVNFFGFNKPICAIDALAVDAYIEHLEDKGNSNGTINRKLAALSKMLRFAHQRRWLDHLPHIERRQEAKGRIRFFTEDEEQALLTLYQRWGKTDMHDLVAVLVDTGLRVGEARGLEWRDVAVDGMKPHVTVWATKNGEARTVPLTRRARDVLHGRRGINKPFDMSRGSIRHAWDRAKDHLGHGSDDQYVPHALRHTCASRLVQRGVPLLVVKEWLGHKTIQMTMRYAHLSPTNLFEAVEKLDL